MDKDGNESIIRIFHKIKFIDRARFMPISLSNLVDNLVEEIHIIKCKDCSCFLQYKNIKDSLIKYQFLSCNEEDVKKIDEKLIN